MLNWWSLFPDSFQFTLPICIFILLQSKNKISIQTISLYGIRIIHDPLIPYFSSTGHRSFLSFLFLPFFFPLMATENSSIRNPYEPSKPFTCITLSVSPGFFPPITLPGNYFKLKLFLMAMIFSNIPMDPFLCQRQRSPPLMTLQ